MSANEGRWGQWGEPGYFCLYGPPNSGKSHNQARAANEHGLYFTRPGGLKPAWGSLGFQLKRASDNVLADPNELLRYVLYGHVQVIPVNTIEEVTRWVAALWVHWASWPFADRPFEYVVTDDYGKMLEQTWLLMRGGIGGDADYDTGWKVLFDTMHVHSNTVKGAEMHGIAGAHESAPKFKRNAKSQNAATLERKGGPKIPGVQAQAQFEHDFDWYARMEPYADGFPHTSGFRANTWTEDPFWELKDRHGVLAGFGVYQANLGEYMRHIGYNVRYPAAMQSWAPGWVEAGAQRVREGEPEAQVYADLFNQLTSKNIDMRHAHWAAEDAVHRVRLEALPQTRFRALVSRGAAGSTEGPPAEAARDVGSNGGGPPLSTGSAQAAGGPPMDTSSPSAPPSTSNGPPLG